MPATRPTDRPRSPFLPGSVGTLAGTLGLLALTACSPAADDPTPRLLSPQELRAGISATRSESGPPAPAIESRAAALRARAAALRAQPATPTEDDDLRRRAQALTAPAP